MLKDTTQIGHFADELLSCADSTAPNFAVVSADATNSLRLNSFCQRYPERVVEVGIAEGCALATAFGLSLTGLKVFVVGYGNFLLLRGMEVVRSYLAYHRADVTILGGMSGLTASHDGFMHQSIEDIGLMRAIEGMKILVPSDEQTARAAARECVREPGPRYVRLVRREVTLPAPLERGEALTWRVKDGDEVLLCSLGPLLEQTVRAAKILRAEGRRVSVLEVGRIAPMPMAELLAATREFQHIVVVEDHLASSGLAAAVAEVLHGRAGRIRRLGLCSSSAGSGDYDAILAAAGLAPERIAAAATELCVERTHTDSV